MLDNKQNNEAFSSSYSSSIEEEELVWKNLLLSLKTILSEKDYHDWIEPLKLEKINSTQIKVSVPNMVFYHTLLAKFSFEFEQAKEKAGLSSFNIYFTPEDEKKPSIKESKNKKSSSNISLTTLFGEIDDTDIDLKEQKKSSSTFNKKDLGSITKTDDYSDKTHEDLKNKKDSSLSSATTIIEENSKLSTDEVALGNFEPKLMSPIKTSGLNSKYTFESFVVGESNIFAHSSCMSVASSPGTAYNPFFLYGATGLGKTHLLHAIGHQIIKQFPNYKITYISSERFTNEMISCMRNNRMSEFRKKYRGCDVLLIDDIQFISNKKATQEEFFHTFNTLMENRKQIVVTSDMHPACIKDVEERLRTRFQWGLSADIFPPSHEHRIAILKKKASLMNLSIDDEILDYIATKAKRNVRDLEGALNKLSAFSGLQARPICMDLAHEIFQHSFSDEVPSSLSIEIVQKEVAEYYKVRMLDLRSQKRIQKLVLPRQVAFYLCRKKLNLSFPEIGAKFGGRDHSTVIHGCKKIEKDIKTDFELKNSLDLIERKLDLFE